MKTLELEGHKLRFLEGYGRNKKVYPYCECGWESRWPRTRTLATKIHQEHLKEVTNKAPAP